jgi:hypothetical protein
VKITLQQFFDNAVIGLRKQGGPSTTDSGNCLYRSPNGCMCAIGFSIPDDRYDSVMETETLDKVLVMADIQTESVPKLRAMQSEIHDDLSGKSWPWVLHFEDAVSKFAFRFNLTIPAKENVT